MESDCSPQAKLKIQKAKFEDSGLLYFELLILNFAFGF